MAFASSAGSTTDALCCTLFIHEMGMLWAPTACMLTKPDNITGSPKWHMHTRFWLPCLLFLLTFGALQ